MKKIIAILAALFAVTAHAQVAGTNSLSTSTASQAASLNSGEGNGNTINSYAPAHQTVTERNVAAPILGAYASSFSQMNCSSTVQVGGAIAGVSLVGGASRDSQTCVLEVAAAELTRQSTIDADHATKLRQAAINVRCLISDQVYAAMEDAGFDCARKPKGMVARTDTQPANYRVAQP